MVRELGVGLVYWPEFAPLFDTCGLVDVLELDVGPGGRLALLPQRLGLPDRTTSSAHSGKPTMPQRLF
jgi:hypothetical protein